VNNINWENLKVLILDVDGTLYNQSKLRKKMLFALFGYYLFRPWQIKDLLILYHFRSEREKKAGYCGTDLENEQYQWCVEKVNVPVEKIKKVVEKWIFEFPNRYLLSCYYPEIPPLLELLKEKNIKTVIYSDYKATQKLDQLKIKADLVLASTDPLVNCLKPNPRALSHIMHAFKVLNTQCLFIGDRDELDGQCAANAGITFLNVKNIINLKDREQANPFQYYSGRRHPS